MHPDTVTEKTRSLVMSEPSQIYPSNEIRSTSTNFITFVPLNIIGQLSNLANIYFVLIAIMQMIPSISLTGGKPTTLLPLAFVMITVLIKDAYEEFYRYLKDKSENQRQVELFRNGNFAYENWENLRVGDVIKIKKNEMIPCDALVISTSELEARCYLETKGLDGETNLKVKKSFLNSTKKKKNSQDAHKDHCPIECIEPNPYLQKFNGFVQIDGEKVPVNSDNLVLRGCFLRNTHQAVCVCIYTGSDTKVILNSVKFQPKRSRLMTQVNQLIIEIFIWQIVIALICALLNTLLENSYPQFMSYLPTSTFFLVAATWWLMMTYFIPISLMVTMEMVKLFQGKLLGIDEEGYSKDYNCYVSANSTSVNQNLGQIKYVFTDKTGTLTKNEMFFKKIYVKGKIYGMKNDEKNQEMNQRLSRCSNINFRDTTFNLDLDGRNNPAQRDALHTALRVLYLCHDIFVEKNGNQYVYNSSSPDEIALINFAKLYDMELQGEKDRDICIGVNGGREILRFQKLAFLEFNSDRKRMSVLVRHPNGMIQLLSKGADSSIASILKRDEFDLAAAQETVDKFSVEGLRTLFMGRRVIQQQQFDQWFRKYQEATTAFSNREEKLSAVYNEIERDLQLVGATAIEDRLQDQVVDTIKSMTVAGMSFFILTGDKKETAINIGRSCGLIEPNAKLCSIPNYTKQDEKNWKLTMLGFKQINQNKVYLLDASKPIPPDLPLHQTICYRCTPSQKQNIVRHVKDSSPFLTMAVGDGANDVNMITAADVGIGVKGKQGTEAARVADFVVGEFKHIKLLSLYYGREWYRKNCRLVLYNFFKNFYHVTAVITFGGFTYFSGVVIFDIYLYEFFNVFFASVPIIVYAVFDEQYNHKESYDFPELYKPGVNNDEFNQSVSGKSIGLGILYGIVSLLVSFYMMETGVLDAFGRTGYLRQSGSVLFFDVVMVVNLKILVMSRGVRPAILISVVGSIMMYWLMYWVIITFVDSKMSVSFGQQWSTPAILMIHCVLVFFLVGIDWAWSKLYEFREKEKRESRADEFANIILKMAL